MSSGRAGQNSASRAASDWTLSGAASLSSKPPSAGADLRPFSKRDRAPGRILELLCVKRTVSLKRGKDHERWGCRTKSSLPLREHSHAANTRSSPGLRTRRRRHPGVSPHQRLEAPSGPLIGPKGRLRVASRLGGARRPLERLIRSRSASRRHYSWKWPPRRRARICSIRYAGSPVVLEFFEAWAASAEGSPEAAICDRNALRHIM